MKRPLLETVAINEREERRAFYMGKHLVLGRSGMQAWRANVLASLSAFDNNIAWHSST